MITNIPSSADTRAYRNNPTTNYGTEAEAYIWTFNGTQYQVSFAKFAGISGIGSPNIPSNSTINSAILWMHIRADGSSLTVSVYTCSADWNESTLIWNNMPGQATSIGSFANMPGYTDGWLSLDITSTVQGWNNGSIPNYGLRLVTNQGGSNSGAFATKESAYVPYIAVDVTPATGNLDISSTPPGAEIYTAPTGQSLTYTGFTTPKIITGLSPGNYDYQLRLAGYYDQPSPPESFTIVGGQITTISETLSPILCPITPKYSGNTVTLNATPKDGIGPYYVEFNKDGSLIDPSRLGSLSNPIFPAPENTLITRIYTLDDLDISSASTGTIDFSVFISDSCPTTPQTCTYTCTIIIGCIAPVCNFTVT